MRRLIAVLALALTIAAPATNAQQNSTVQVDARAEVAAALYAASATQAAAERAADARLREAQAEIARLAAQGETARAQLAAAQEHFVEDLARRDRAFGQEIAVFRRAVEDIASTPEGTAALARFNNGDEIGALAVLDELVDARERARMVRATLETAAERRRVATLALEARARGRLDTLSVVARFEEVVRLDDNEFWDHIELCRLFVDAGRLDDASRSASRALVLASDPRSQMVALIDYGDVLGTLGHLDTAQTMYNRGLTLARALATDQSNWFGPGDLSVALSRLGDVSMAMGQFRESLPFYNEALRTDQEWHQRTLNLAAAQNVCADLANLTDAIVALADLVSADQYADLAVRTCEWVSNQSTSGDDALRVGYARWRHANIRAALGDIPFARRTFADLSSLADQARRADPSNQRIAAEANLLELSIADLDLLEGHSEAARRRIESVISELQRLREAEGLIRLVDTYVWLARVRLATIPGSQVTWTELRGGWSANSLDVENLSALDFHFVSLAQEGPASQ
jgi:tetratricopeptide (TPR) repeat protein